MEKIPPESSLNLPPTGRQARAITKLCLYKGISEPLEERPSNRREARNLIYELRNEKRRKGGETHAFVYRDIQA
jgi:hypothetical protein